MTIQKQSLSDAYCHQIITTYQNHSPNFVAPTDIEMDLDSNCFYFRFYVMHPRLEDHLVVRSQDGEITCNLILDAVGAHMNPTTCSIDKYGLRWIMPPNHNLDAPTKNHSEAWMRTIYALSCAFSGELQFLLGSKNLLSNVKEKASG